MSNQPPDPTPPSPPLPPWGRQLLKQVQELQKDHVNLKSLRGADVIAYRHLMESVGDATEELATSTERFRKQVWGAINELRKQLKERK